MAIEEAIEGEGRQLFQRAAAAGGQLLQAQRLGESGVEGKAAAFVLTFDVGRVLVRADPVGESLLAQPIVSVEDLPSGLSNAMEEEPWWRLLGTPLSDVHLAPGGGAIELLFQLGDRSRCLALCAEGGGIRATLRD